MKIMILTSCSALTSVIIAISMALGRLLCGVSRRVEGLGLNLASLATNHDVIIIFLLL